MLNKRVNIFFNDRTWKRVSSHAKRVRRSTSELIREAVDSVYGNQKQQTHQKKAFANILAKRPRISQSTIDYKSLIDDGRRV